jgi:two-component system, NtrC family, nitrogen regulation sensor histidine kinase NtrY
VVRLEGAAVIRRWLPFAVGAGILVWVAALVMLAMTAEGPQRFGELYLAILLINVTGVIALLVLIGGRLADFVRDWRRHVPGSRLRGRTLLMFGGLAIAPLLLVFTFSVTFLTRGIDSWFHAEVRQGLTDALGLSRAALDLRMREYLERTNRIAGRLEGLTGGSLYLELDDELRNSGAEELIVTSAGGQPIAYSRAGMVHELPAVPPEELLLQLRQGRPHVSLQPAQGGGYLVRAATAIRAGPASSHYLLVANYPVPQRLSDLAATVQQAYQQYGQLSFLREPLKATFVLTLSLVLLMALLAAMYGALYFSERLVRPVQDLIAGTRAVAKGDFDTRLLRASHDEVGFLVTSFNDMTKKLARAREDTERSRAAVEAERAALAVILARLTSGVISLEPDLRVRVANAAAGATLGVDFADAAGRPLDEVAAGHPLLAELHEALRRHLDAGQTEWREQLTLRTDAGRREIVAACTALPGDAGAPGGLVLVFDEVTQLLQAQRQAAWGEVARRLAHEIRNPLTPIQLSAERMRRKLMRGLAAPEAELLDRSTHTIVQQVEAMKQMVAAFSEYAKAPEMHISEFDLGALIRQVSDLYHAQDPRVAFGLSLDPKASALEADPGRIRQLLNNLLTNSLEALDGRENPVIMIETRRAGGQVALTVVDNGPGFQGRLLEQAFDPYVTSKPKGTGLGLAIVRRIVEEHGGQVEVDNAPQGGARVRIQLPATAREARRAEARREKA